MSSSSNIGIHIKERTNHCFQGVFTLYGLSPNNAKKYVMFSAKVQKKKKVSDCALISLSWKAKFTICPHCAVFIPWKFSKIPYACFKGPFFQQAIVTFVYWEKKGWILREKFQASFIESRINRDFYDYQERTHLQSECSGPQDFPKVGIYDMLGTSTEKVTQK